VDEAKRRTLGALVALGSGLAMSEARAQGARLAERAIPSSGEMLPVVGLGTWQTFDVGGDAAARAPLGEVLATLYAGGGRVVDSSPMYGSSEAVVGELCAARNLCAPLFLATKVWTRGRAQGVSEMERSIRRMRAGRMDLMQVHNLVDVDTHTATLRDWKREGRVRYIGITHYTASAYAEVERWLKTKQYDFLQINYSLAEREAERRILPLARELGVAVLINRPFGEGNMFRRVRGKPLPSWAAELGIASWAQFFLRWILAHPAVTCAIPGTSKPEHMKDNLAAGRAPLPGEAERARLAAHFDAL
jgi:aryl-alcohol dehydrogenase-like predicted oxidoreductase